LKLRDCIPSSVALWQNQGASIIVVNGGKVGGKWWQGWWKTVAHTS